MNFIETVFESINKGIKQVTGEFPYDIKSYCIGSGSNFIIHRHVSNNMAKKIYEDYKNTLHLGSEITHFCNGEYILESFNKMESNSGVVFTFMFPITEVVEHNPNDILDEWYEINKERKGFVDDILSLFTKKKERIK